MHGKGAGAVNRVELECQVLCAALRQSWVRHDKVGAFTSIRELSHLFPDLLPPPEELNGSNKANYYEVLTVRPGSGLNGLVVAYLRSVRKFLKDHNPKDYRQFYNTILNAGFTLRKPRLRLSHDLVVARRWLYESQLEEEAAEAVEPVTEQLPVVPEEKIEQPEPVAAAATAATAAIEEEEEVPLTPVFEELPQAVLAAAKPVIAAAETPPPEPPAVDSQPEEEYDPLEIIQQSWQQAKLSAQPKTSFEMPAQSFSPESAPSLTPPVVQVPPVPPLPQLAEAPSTPAQRPSVETTQSLPVTPIPQTPVQVAEVKAQEPAAPPRAEVKAQEQAPPRAEVKAQAPAPPPRAEVKTHPPADAQHGFHFDEKQLRKPEAEIELPAVIRLMEAAHLITKVEVQALKAQMQLAPNISVEQLMMNAGYATRNELLSLRLAQDLLSSGKINMAQFQVAMYDERTSGLRMAESLQVRGWLETEVRNPIEEFKKSES